MHDHHEPHDDFGGLQRDLAATSHARLLSRRSAVRALGLFGSAALVNCGGSPTSPSTSSTDASLSGLTVSGATLSPAFSAATTAYTVTVANNVSAVTVTATASNSAAKVFVNGALVTSGAASNALNLSIGANQISIAVAAVDGTTTLTYGVAVTRSSNVGSACSGIPNETAGPYPGDGSNGPNVLNVSGVVRSDIRSSFGGLTGNADGVPLTLVLTLVSASSCAVLAGRAIYLWHCDRPGNYSLYSAGALSQNYLRGVQQADANGVVMFTTVFPGCYAGRWPHIHFEVYPSLAAATSVNNKIATSQIALPKAACDLAYAATGYQSSITNLSQVSLASDNVFSDGATLELATVTGSVVGGFTATLTVAV